MDKYNKVPYGRFQKILPAVYDDILSYEDQVAKLTYSMNEVITAVNTIPDQILEALKPFESEFRAELSSMKLYVDTETASARRYVDDNISMMQNELDVFKTDMINRQVSFEQGINVTINEFSKKIEKEIADFENNVYLMIIDIIAEIDTRFNEMKVYFDGKFAVEHQWTVEVLNDLQKQIDDLVFKLPDMYDPTRGKKNPVATTIHNVYNADRYYGIGASEFDDVGMTAGEFEGKGVKALRFDTYSREDLSKSTPFYMRDPFTGSKIKLAAMIEKLIGIVMTKGLTAYTCGEWDQLDVTARTFDNKSGLTAYKFDFTSKELFP